MRGPAEDSNAPRPLAHMPHRGPASSQSIGDRSFIRISSNHRGRPSLHYGTVLHSNAVSPLSTGTVCAGPIEGERGSRAAHGGSNMAVVWDVGCAHGRWVVALGPLLRPPTRPIPTGLGEWRGCCPLPPPNPLSLPLSVPPPTCTPVHWGVRCSLCATSRPLRYNFCASPCATGAEGAEAGGWDRGVGWELQRGPDVCFQNACRSPSPKRQNNNSW